MTDDGVKNTIARMRRDGVFFDADETGSGSAMVINFNDCWGWAIADGEDITGHERAYAEVYAEHGWDGIFALTAIRRGYDPDPDHLNLFNPGYRDEFDSIKATLVKS